MPLYDLANEGGTRLFVSVDLDPEWTRGSLARGRYVSTGWIPVIFSPKASSPSEWASTLSIHIVVEWKWPTPLPFG